MNFSTTASTIIRITTSNEIFTAIHNIELQDLFICLQKFERKMFCFENPFIPLQCQKHHQNCSTYIHFKSKNIYYIYYSSSRMRFRRKKRRTLFIVNFNFERINNLMLPKSNSKYYNFIPHGTLVVINQFNFNSISISY